MWIIKSKVYFIPVLCMLVLGSSGCQKESAPSTSSESFNGRWVVDVEQTIKEQIEKAGKKPSNDVMKRLASQYGSPEDGSSNYELIVQGDIIQFQRRYNQAWQRSKVEFSKTADGFVALEVGGATPEDEYRVSNSAIKREFVFSASDNRMRFKDFEIVWKWSEPATLQPITTDIPKDKNGNSPVDVFKLAVADKLANMPVSEPNYSNKKYVSQNTTNVYLNFQPPSKYSRIDYSQEFERVYGFSHEISGTTIARIRLKFGKRSRSMLFELEEGVWKMVLTSQG